MNPVPESILERIQKLQALAERAGTEAEAVNAASRVRELLDKYNLELGEIVLREQGPWEQDVFQTRRKRTPAMELLLNSVSRLCGVGMYWLKAALNKHGELVSPLGRPANQLVWIAKFYGSKGNVETAIATFEYFTASIDALYKARRSEFLFSAQLVREPYVTGCAQRIAQRIKECIESRNESPEAMAIVLVTDELRAQRERELKQIGLKNLPPKAIQTPDKFSFAQGRRDAERVDLEGTGKQLA